MSLLSTVVLKRSVCNVCIFYVFTLFLIFNDTTLFFILFLVVHVSHNIQEQYLLIYRVVLHFSTVVDGSESCILIYVSFTWVNWFSLGFFTDSVVLYYLNLSNAQCRKHSWCSFNSCLSNWEKFSPAE